MCKIELSTISGYDIHIYVNKNIRDVVVTTGVLKNVKIEGFIDKAGLHKIHISVHIDALPKYKALNSIINNIKIKSK